MSINMGYVRLIYDELNTDYEERIKFYIVLCELLNKIKQKN